MNQWGKSCLFWGITIVLFGCPFLFYWLDQRQPIQTTMVAAPAHHPSPASISVHVAGDTQQAGVYQVVIGTRLHDFLDELGITDPEAISHLNLAKPLRDGQRISIKHRQKSTRININLSTSKDLASLPGIGPQTVKKIVAYRTQHGVIKNDAELARIIGASRLKKVRHAIDY